MAEAKTTIYYNHNFYYDFSKIISADDRGLQFGDGCYEWIRVIPLPFPTMWTVCTAPCVFWASVR